VFKLHHRWLRTFTLFWIGLLFCLWLAFGPIHWSKPVVAQPSPTQLVQQGVDHYQSGDLPRAIQDWQTALKLYEQSGDQSNQAIVLENLARASRQIGRTEQSLNYWQEAAAIYQQQGNRPQLGRTLTEQAQTFSRQGQHRQAIGLLCNPTIGNPCTPDSAISIAQTTGNQADEAAAWGSLGEAYRLRGNYEQAENALENSRVIAEEIQNPVYLTSVLNSLGNTHVNLALVRYRQATSAQERGDTATASRLIEAGLEEDQQALQAFQQGLAITEQPASRLRLTLSTIAPAFRVNQPDLALDLLQQARSLLPTLPNSQEKTYAAIDLAHLLQPIPPVEVQATSGEPLETNLRTGCFSPAVEAEAAELLQQAVQIAKQIADSRSESFAVGELGHIYECRKDYQQALELTQQARWAAEQDLKSKDSLYLWEWQTGRILIQQGNEDEAIPMYEKAVATLESIRSELLTANRDIQFDFRDAIDPLYRQLVTLRLPDPVQAVDSDPANLSAALKTLDSLKLAELQNYFGNDCVVIAPTQETVDRVGAGQNTAVFNSVILPERTAVIVNFPNGEKQISWIEIDQDTLKNQVNEYRRELERFYKEFDSQYAAQVYNWIIAPFAERLVETEVETLVFVQDGILRSVPMAALYNAQAQQFLVEQYAIATTPSLTLTDARPLERKNLRALAVGLTQGTVIDNQQFLPLDNVDAEITAVAAQLPGSRVLLDQNFTRQRIEQELDRTTFPILHIATHGEFGTEPENTFLVTGESNNKKLTITDLDQIFRRTKSGRQVELLSLTACQTATGDDRSALGLAGVAIQAGAKSALASLWFIDDAATAKIAAQFYANLQQDPKATKATALQSAQIEVLKAGGETAHPAYWAPFILIGNWL
jgi:CHAT domain-containing protein